MFDIYEIFKNLPKRMEWKSFYFPIGLQPFKTQHTPLFSQCRLAQFPGQVRTWWKRTWKHSDFRLYSAHIWNGLENKTIHWLSPVHATIPCGHCQSNAEKKDTGGCQADINYCQKRIRLYLSSMMYYQWVEAFRKVESIELIFKHIPIGIIYQPVGSIDRPISRTGMFHAESISIFQLNKNQRISGTYLDTFRNLICLTIWKYWFGKCI